MDSKPDVGFDLCRAQCDLLVSSIGLRLLSEVCAVSMDWAALPWLWRNTSGTSSRSRSIFCCLQNERFHNRILASPYFRVGLAKSGGGSKQTVSYTVRKPRSTMDHWNERDRLCHCKKPSLATFLLVSSSLNMFTSTLRNQFFIREHEAPADPMRHQLVRSLALLRSKRRHC